MATETNINNINKSQVRERNNEQYLTQCLLQHYNCLITINKGKKIPLEILYYFSFFSLNL